MPNAESVPELIARLTKEAAADRAVEEKARRSAAAKERAAEALAALLEDDEQAVSTQPSRNGDQPGLRGKRAIMRLLSDDPERVWSPSEVHAELVDREWITPGITHAKQGTETTLARLVRQGLVERIGRGQYRWVRREGGLLAE